MRRTHGFWALPFVAAGRLGYNGLSAVGSRTNVPHLSYGSVGVRTSAGRPTLAQQETLWRVIAVVTKAAMVCVDSPWAALTITTVSGWSTGSVRNGHKPASLLAARPRRERLVSQVLVGGTPEMLLKPAENVVNRR